MVNPYFFRLLRDLLFPHPPARFLRTWYVEQHPASSDESEFPPISGCLTTTGEALPRLPTGKRPPADELPGVALAAAVKSGEHGAVVLGVAESAALYDISTGLSLKNVQLSRTGDPHRRGTATVRPWAGEVAPARTHSPSVS